MQLEGVLTDSLNLKDSFATQENNYIQTTGTPYTINNLPIKTNYDLIISIGLLITIGYVFYCIRKKIKK